MAAWARKIQIGTETTAGTAVAATTIWRGEGQYIKDESPIELIEESIGVPMNILRSVRPQQMASLKFAATPLTFEQGPYAMEAGIKKLAAPAADGAGSGRIYAYNLGTTQANEVRFYTMESGDDQQAREMEYSFVEKFSISAEAGQTVRLDAVEWRGRKATNTTFTPTLTVPTVEYVFAQKGAFYLNTAGGTFGGTPISTTLLKWKLDVTTGWRVKNTVDSGQLYFAYAYFDKDLFQARLALTYEHNVTGVAQITDMEAETVKLARIQHIGSALTTAGTNYTNKTFRMDLPILYLDASELKKENGNSIIEMTAAVGYSATAGVGPTWTFVNQLASLP